MTAYDGKSAAHAVNGSTGGRGEQISKTVSTISVPETSVPETGRLVKGGEADRDWARRLAVMLTERQKRDVVSLAQAIGADTAKEAI